MLSEKVINHWLLNFQKQLLVVPALLWYPWLWCLHLCKSLSINWLRYVASLETFITFWVNARIRKIAPIAYRYQAVESLLDLWLAVIDLLEISALDFLSLAFPATKHEGSIQSIGLLNHVISYTISLICVGEQPYYTANTARENKMYSVIMKLRQRQMRQ